MGNRLVFGDRTKYVQLEAGIGAGLLGLTILGIIPLFVIYFCCCRKKRDCSTNSGTCCSCCKDYLTSAKHFHRILGNVFPSISELYIESKNTVDDKSENCANVKSKNNPAAIDTKTKTVLIISEREVPSGSIGCLTYFYFTYMLLMCSLWFIAMLVELMVYRKTGTCNDINVKVQSFSCFDVDNNYTKIDCEQTPDIDTRHVICYLYNPNIGAFGVAFSTAILFSKIGDFAFNFILKCTKKCCKCLVVVRISVSILVVIVFIVFMVVAHDPIAILDTNYFTYAGIPMRWVQLLLLFATALGILLFPPWTEYSDDDYNTKYLHLGYKDAEKGEKPQDTKSKGKQAVALSKYLCNEFYQECNLDCTRT